MMANSRIQALIWDAVSFNHAQNEAGSLSEFILALKPLLRVALSGSSLNELGQVLGQRWEIAPAIDRLILLPGTDESPQPEAYARAAQSLKAQPEETVWIAAEPGQVQDARSAGLQAVLYESPAQAGSEIFRMLTA